MKRNDLSLFSILILLATGCNATEQSQATGSLPPAEKEVAALPSAAVDTPQNASAPESPIVNTPELRHNEWFSVNVSKMNAEDSDIFTEDGFELFLMLGPVSHDADQRPTFNEEKGEGILALGFAYRTGTEEFFRSTPAFYVNRQNYLFTKTNQKWIRYPYDAKEAQIFLRTGNAEPIAVGQYRKATRDHAHNTWSHPLLCEGAYASVCELRVGLTYDPRLPGIPYVGTIVLKLKTSGEELPIAVAPNRNGWNVSDPFSTVK